MVVCFVEQTFGLRFPRYRNDISDNPALLAAMLFGVLEFDVLLPCNLNISDCSKLSKG